MDPRPDVHVFADRTELAEAAAQCIVTAATDAVATQQHFAIALAGGATPRATHTRLAQSPYNDALPWRRTLVFFGDERCVPPEHPESNYRMAYETLLSKVPLPPDQVFRIRGEADDAEVAAAEYSRTVAEVCGTRRGELARFDLILLGMGVDGHTASLFPGSPVLKEIFRPVAAVHAAAAAIPKRITLTLPVLNAAAHVVFLVEGAEKAKAVKAVLVDGTLLPAGMVRPVNGRLTWLLDRAAATHLG